MQLPLYYHIVSIKLLILYCFYHYTLFILYLLAIYIAIPAILSKMIK